MNRIIVIVVTFNGIKWIEECLKSIYNSSVEVEVVVVDNNSTDSTVLFIKQNFPLVVVFEQSTNLGFGKANNIGLSYAVSKNADFVFLLNQDAFLYKTTIENLVVVSHGNPDYGIISPIHLNYQGSLLESHFFSFMSRDNSRAFYSDFVLGNQIKDIYDIDFIQAAAWLLPRKTLLKIGGFDPIFFHYGEDDNYCYRVLYHKLKIGVVPDVFIRHDSNVNPRDHGKQFSEKYYKKYLLALFHKYCNINSTFTNSDVTAERLYIYKYLLVSALSLNFIAFKGNLRKLKLLNANISAINISRLTNIKVDTHYLLM